MLDVIYENVKRGDIACRLGHFISELEMEMHVPLVYHGLSNSFSCGVPSPIPQAGRIVFEISVFRKLRVEPVSPYRVLVFIVGIASDSLS